MSRRELSLWVFGALVLVSAQWAFSFPLYEPAVSPAVGLAAAEATQPTQGSTAANTYCKSVIGKVEDVTKVQCSDKEASGVVVRGHCTTGGGCQVTEYKCPDETWKKISDRTACALQPAAPVPVSDETGFQTQPAVGQVAPLPQQSLNQINAAFESGAKPLDTQYGVNPTTGQLEALLSQNQPGASASGQSAQSFNYTGPSDTVSDLGNPVSQINTALNAPQSQGEGFSSQSGFVPGQEMAAEQKSAEQGGSWWARAATEACQFFTFGLACSSAQAGNSRTDAEVIAAGRAQTGVISPQQPVVAPEQSTQQSTLTTGVEVRQPAASTAIEYPSGDSVRPTVLAGELSHQQADKLQAQAQAFETQRQQVVANTGWGTGLSVDCPGVCRTVTENGVTQPRSAYNSTVDSQIATLKTQADQWETRAAFFNSSDPLAAPAARTLIEGGTRATLVEGNLDAMLRARTIVQAGQSVSGAPYGDTEVSASMEKANYSQAQLERLTSGGDFTQTEKDVIRKSNPNNLTAEEFNAELKTQKYAGTLSGTIYNAVTSINNPTAAQQQSRLFLSDSEIAQQQAGDVTKASLAVGTDALLFAAMTPPGMRVFGAGINALGLAPALDAVGSGATRVGSVFLDSFETRAFSGWARSAGITDLPVSYGTDLAVYTPAEGSAPLTTLEKTVALRDSYSEAYLNALRSGDTAAADMNLVQWKSADSATQRLGGTGGISPEDLPSAPLRGLGADVSMPGSGQGAAPFSVIENPLKVETTNLSISGQTKNLTFTSEPFACGGECLGIRKAQLDGEQVAVKILSDEGIANAPALVQTHGMLQSFGFPVPKTYVLDDSGKFIISSDQGAVASLNAASDLLPRGSLEMTPQIQASIQYSYQLATALGERGIEIGYDSLSLQSDGTLTLGNYGQITKLNPIDSTLSNPSLWNVGTVDLFWTQAASKWFNPEGYAAVWEESSALNNQLRDTLSEQGLFDRAKTAFGFTEPVGIPEQPVFTETVAENSNVAAIRPDVVPMTTLENSITARDTYYQGYEIALAGGDTDAAENALKNWQRADTAVQRFGGATGPSPEDIPSAPLNELSAGVNSGVLRGGESPIVDGLGIYRGAPGQWPVLVRENGSRVMTEGTSGTWLSEASGLVKTEAQYQRLVQEYYGDDAKFSYLSDGSMTVRNGEGIPRQADTEVYEELRRIGLRVAPAETDALQPSLSAIDSTALEVSNSAAVDVTPAPQVVAPGETLDMRITEAPAWGERDISIAVGKQISEGGLYGAIWEGTMTDKATGEVKNIALKQFDPKQSDWGHMLEIMNVHSALQQVGLPVPTLYAITSDVGSLQQFAVMENFNVNGFVALSANNESALVAPQSIGVISNFDDAARSMVQTSLRVAEQGYIAHYDAYFGVVNPNVPVTPMNVVVGDFDQVRPVPQDSRDPVGRAAEENIFYANKFLRGFVFQWVRSADAVGEYAARIRTIIADELDAWNARRHR
ncbi:MAG: hypothetical protein AAB480_04750 [Patescibacteria group bacterium]